MRAHLEHNTEEMAWIAQHQAEPIDHRVGAGPSRTIDQFAIHGKDVSSYQPVGLFSEAGRRFAFFKASEGVTYIDPHFRANRVAAHEDATIELAGIYHFARNQRNAADAEYDHFKSVVGPPQPGECMILDAEVGWDQTWFCRFADRAAADGWTVRLFYTYAGMWSVNPHDQIPAHFTHGWIAGYGGALPAMAGWPGGQTFWQHTDGQASVAGNDGGTDCSVFVPNDIEALRRLAGGPAPTPAPPHRIEEDVMYIRCAVPGKDWALLSGDIFQGLGDPGEIKSAEENVAKGALVQWVIELTWDDLSAKGAKPVKPTAPTR